MMAKYGRSLRFGFAPDLGAADPRRPLHLAKVAETAGLDYVGLWERSTAGATHDLWTVLTAIGMATSRISLYASVGSMVQPPARLAKAAATLAQLTSGRLELGLMGAPGHAGGDDEVLAALDEAIQVIRLMWRGERAVHFAGRHHQLDEVNPGPPPSHPIGIWLDGNTSHAVGLIGRVANGWLAESYPALQPQELARLGKQLDEAATSAGRDAGDIQRVWCIEGSIADAPSSALFQGSAEQWAELIAEVALDAGIDTFVLAEGQKLECQDVEAQLERFAHEVAPRARQLIEARVGNAVPRGLARAQQGAAASGATVAEEATGHVDLVDETSMESFPASDPPASSSYT